MFTFTGKEKDQKPTSLEMEIERLFGILEELDPTSEDYERAANQLAKLYKLKEIDNNSNKPVSKDEALKALTNLTGILLILNYERLSVITTKAFGLIRKV